LTSIGEKDLADEMTIDGIGADFVALEQKGEAIVPEEFVRWYHTESRGNKLIDHLETQFQ